MCSLNKQTYFEKEKFSEVFNRLTCQIFSNLFNKSVKKIIISCGPVCVCVVYSAACAH